MRELLATHPDPFHATSPSDWEAELGELRASLPELSDHEIVVSLMQLVARVRDGHTWYDSENGSHGFDTLFPVVVYPFADGLHVIAAVEEHADLVGARVTRYGAVGPEEALDLVATTVAADNRSGELRGAPYALQRPAILDALRITPELGLLPLALVTREGEAVEVELEPISREDERFRREALVFANELTDAEPPVYLEHAPTRFHWLKHAQPPLHEFRILDSPHILYAQINRIRDAHERSFAEFCEELFATFDERGLERLVLDLRHCPGGNNTLLRPLIHGILRREVLLERGHIFVVTDRHTFSAAMNLVTRLERETRGADGSSMILVGEAPAGAPNHFGDSKVSYHYRTDLTLMVSEYRWQDSVPWDGRRSMEPDLPAPLRFADYRDSRDPALIAIELFLGR